MHSGLYVGQVKHCRFTPRKHAFRYRLFLFYLDLDELVEAIDRFPGCSSRRPALVWFRRSDHLGNARVPLKKAVQRTIVELGGPQLNGSVRLLTHLRYCGYGFNPVSFYFCYDETETLQAILAEVNNTPWGEQHCYLIPVTSASGSLIRHTQEKAFHVSPFMGLDMQYRWAISNPSERLNISIETLRKGERLFTAAMTLRRKPLSARALYATLLRFPLMTTKVIGAIYFEALRLWLKRIPVHTHTKLTEAPSAAKTPK